MSTQQVLKEIRSIKTDFKEGRLTIEEVISGLSILAKNSPFWFSDLYNAFYSSQPELYIN